MGMSQPYGASRINRGGLPMASVGPSRHGAENRIHFLEFAEQSFDVDAMNANAMDAETTNADVVDALTSKARQLSSEAGGELERCCWMVVHEHHHGVKPTEYDIREIDEQLYLAVLNGARTASDL